MSGKKKKTLSTGLVAENRRARFDYALGDTLEAGMVLTGTEVKSLREGKANITESYASTERGELWLINAYIPEYAPASRFNHEPRRPRKLLIRRKQLNKLFGSVEREGQTIVPLKLYFSDRGVAKIELALAKGKKNYDKRQTNKDRDWARDKARLMREQG